MMNSFHALPVFAARVTTLFLLLLLAGCGKDAGKAAGESDSNGYLCRKCQMKFYTAQSVFAEFCPGCKSYDVKPVVGYVCSADGHATFVMHSQRGVVCEKCKAPVAAIKLPREVDFQAWGAKKMERKDVCAPR